MSDTLDLIKQHGLDGAGGGSKKPKTPPPPKEEPNTLRSVSKGRILDLIAHGPVVGLAEGLQSVYLDGTPLQNPDGSFNMEGVVVTTREGYPDQEYIPGFRAVENPISINTEVTFDNPVVRSVSNNDADAVVVTLQVNALTFQDQASGDLRGHSVTMAIDIKRGAGSWVQRVYDTISGKTTSPYQRSYRVELGGGGPWEVRVRRISPDDERANIQSTTGWFTMTEVVDARLSYPDSALIGIELDAQLFGNQMPAREYDMLLSIIKVPSNYNPKTRTYTGIWNGTFKNAWSDNPAWVYYDLATHPVIGAGLTNVDKWGLYRIAQYCDELVPDGYGGMEPRFTVNTLFTAREEAITTLTTLASAFRGMTYWGTNTVVAAADMPGDAKKLVSPANVVDGEFEYSGTGLKERHSVAIVMWNDPEDSFKPIPEFVEDPESVELFGWRETQVTAFGCSSRGQAHRLGKWILYSERNETEVVSYRAVADQADLRPGDYIHISDPDRAGARLSGRVLEPGLSSLLLDKIPGEVSGNTWFLSVVLPSGAIERRAVYSFAGDRAYLDDPLSAVPMVGAMWILSSLSVVPPMYRVATVDEEGESGVYRITATEHDPNKYRIVEEGLKLPETSHSLIPAGSLAAPKDITVAVFTYLAGGTEHQAITVSWTPSDDPRVTGYIAEVQGPNDVKWRTAYSGAGNSFDERDAEPGQWMIRVRSVTSVSTYSSWVSRTVNIAGLLLPVPPDSVDIKVGTFEVTLVPRGAYPSAVFEFWRSGAALDVNLIESNAVRLAVGPHLVDTGLTPDTTYFYYIRGANSYGVSAWYPVQVTTENDPALILKVLSEQIREGHLHQELAKRIDLIDAPEGVLGSVASQINAAKQEAEADIAAIDDRVDQVQAHLGAEVTRLNSEVSQAASEAVLARQRVDTEAARLDGRVDGVASSVAQVQGNLMTEANRLSGLANQAWNAADQAATNLSTEVVRLDGRVDSVASELNTTKSQVIAESARLDARSDNLTSQLENAQQGLTDAEIRLDGRIDGVRTAAQTLRSDLEAADALLDQRLSGAESAIVEEVVARQELALEVAERLTGLQVEVDDGRATLGQIQRVQAEAEAVEAIQFEAINAVRAGAQASLRTEEVARADADGALARRTDVLEARIASNSAAVISEAQARADKDSALASQIGELSAKVDALPQFASGFEAGSDFNQWTVPAGESLTVVTANPYAGFQAALLTSTASNPSTTATIRADIHAGATQAFAGFEVVVRVAAILPESDASAEFALAYTSAAGNSGWHRFTPTSSWTEFEFRYTVPEGHTGNDTIAVWADTSGTGKGVILDSLRVSRASGEIAEISAAVEAEQLARAEGDSALASDLAALTARVGTTEAGITAEQAARVSADSALTSSVAALTSRMGDAEAGIATEQTTRANADSALASRATNLESRVNTAEAGLIAERTARTTAVGALASDVSGLTARMDTTEAGITTESQARADADSALADQITLLTSQVEGDIQTALTVESRARADADTALAHQITSLTAAVGAVDAELTSQVEAVATDAQAMARRQDTMEAGLAGNEAAITSLERVQAEEDMLSAIERRGLEVRGHGTQAGLYVERDARIDEDGALASQLTALSAEVDSNAAAIVAEQTARTTADSALASDISALSAEVDSNAAAIVAEQTARTTADSALARDISALSAEVDSNAAAIVAEQTARTTADSALARDISALSAEVDSNAAAIVAEQTARTTADSALTSSMNALASRVGTAESAITAERTARATADSALADSISGLQAEVDGQAAEILEQQQARVEGDLALAEDISSLRVSQAGSEAQINELRRVQDEVGQLSAIDISAVEAKRQGNSAGIYTEQEARVQGDEALAQQITVLSAQLGTTNATVTSEAQARADGDSALASQLGELSAKVDALPQFASGFEDGADFEQWVTPARNSLAAVSSSPYAGLQCGQASSSVANPLASTLNDVIRAVIPVGVTNAFRGYEVRIKVAAKRPASNAAAEFAIAYSAGAAGNSGWWRFSPTADWTEFEFSYTVPDGAAGTSDTLGIWADTSGAGKAVMLDSIRISRVAGEVAEISAALVAEQQARASGDQALATDLSALTARMATAEAGITAEQTARTTADSALASSVNALTSRVGTAESAITAEQTARTTADSALAGRATRLESRMGSAESAITAEQTARATADSALLSSVSALTARMGTAEAGLASETGARVTEDSALARDISRLRVLRDDDAAVIDDVRRVQAEEGALLAVEIHSVEAKREGVNAAVYLERDARVTGDDAIASQVTALTSRMGSAEAGIAVEQQARASADTALASQLTALQTQANGNTAAIQAEQQARADGDSALASQLTTLRAQATSNTAAIQTEQQARASADTALASQITTLQTSIDGEFAAVQEKIEVAGQGGNLFPTGFWKEGTPVPASYSSGGVTITPNGALSEQAFFRTQTGPHGVSQVVWLSQADGDNQADGGWDATFSQLDPLKGYMLSVWVYAHATSGTLYLGCSRTQTLNLDGTANANPYFWTGVPPVRGKWYLAVGVLHGSGYTGGQTGISGLYDPETGARVGAGTDYKMKPGATSQMHRTYQFYSPAGGQAFFSLPRLELLEGVGSVQQLMAGTLVKGLTASFTLKLDVNGYVSGYGAYNDGKTSEFAVRADRFYVADPSTKSEVLPFIVAGGQVYIRAAVIQDASITGAKIANASITGAKIQDASITNAKIGNELRSTSTDSQGRPSWLLRKDGTFQLNGTGATGRIEQRNNYIKVFDASGIRRVQIGDLSA